MSKKDKEKTNTEKNNKVSEKRIWASQWYQITPRSFEHFELFFDPKNVYLDFVNESYKSLLLRQQGRDIEAKETGERHLNLPGNEILSQSSKNKKISIKEINKIEITPGTLLKKPKLFIFTKEKKYKFYHFSRKHDVKPLHNKLKELYSELEIKLN